MSKFRNTSDGCSRAPLAYRVLDGGGHPLRELREYVLALEVTLARPDGASVAVAMERDRSLGDGTFRSTQDPLCDREGRYWIDVRVTTADATGHRLEVFRDRWSGFSVPASSDAECRTARASVPPLSMSPIVKRNTGAPSATPIQKRRVMSTSSGFAASVRSATRGSRAIPQIGQAPGLSLSTSGSIGQTYARATGTVAVDERTNTLLLQDSADRLDR